MTDMKCKTCRLRNYCDGDCEYLEKVLEIYKMDSEDMIEWKDMYEKHIFDDLIIEDCIQSKREKWLWER